MYINKVVIHNFRILSNSTLDFKEKLCLMIGRNNSGKTSFMVLFEKFLHGLSFDFNDFSVNLRKKILKMDETTDETELAIQLILNIEYEDCDDLCNLSEFIVDLDPQRKDVNLLFECSINKDKLLEKLKSIQNITKEKFIKKYLSDYLDKNIYTFDSIEDMKTQNRYKLIKKEFKDVNKLIDFEIIHAKRSVSSSEEKNGMKVLSGLTTTFFNNLHKSTPDKFEDINKLIERMDSDLDSNYDNFFSDFLKNARDFLSMDGLRVISNLKAKEILTDSSEVVYGNSIDQLPEYLNGLGHMNILYLLLNIEIKKNNFLMNNKDIKILFIEEPEAHTHPQLQYIFARKISTLLQDLSGMQTIISTHSPQIVANHPFENIRYMLNISDDSGHNIEIINFHESLKNKYVNEQKEFQFLKQYLSIESAELFFADKAIFIEGISESMLMQYFISKFDAKKLLEEKKSIQNNTSKKSTYIPLSSQNITIVQAGANAKAFKYFLELLKIPAVIITDIDTTKPKSTPKGVRYEAAAVCDNETSNTSNETIKYYFNAPKNNDDDFKQWFYNLLNHNMNCKNNYIKISYQIEENSYYPRSFEDAFININIDNIKFYINELKGLHNKSEIETNKNTYDITKDIIDKKSDFAASILYLAHTSNVEWKVPLYIEEGLEWLQKN